MSLEIIIASIVAGTAALGLIAKLMHHTIFKPVGKLDSKVSDIEQENTRTDEKLTKLSEDIKDVKAEPASSGAISIIPFQNGAMSGIF